VFDRTCLTLHFVIFLSRTNNHLMIHMASQQICLKQRYCECHCYTATQTNIFSSRSCLNATPAFGQLAIPVFVEKLTAGYPTTKVSECRPTMSTLFIIMQRDTLQALSSCLPVYGAALASTAARKLWSALKLEVNCPHYSMGDLSHSIPSVDIPPCRFHRRSRSASNHARTRQDHLLGVGR